MAQPLLLIMLALATLFLFKSRFPLDNSVAVLCFIASLTPLIATAAYLLLRTDLAGPPLGIGLLASGLLSIVLNSFNRSL